MWLCAGEQPFELPAGDRADLVGAQSSGQCDAEHERRGRDGTPVRGVGGEQDLAGRDQREQRELIGGVPPGGVEEQVALAGGLAPDPGEIGDRQVREDDRGTRERSRELERAASQRWNPAAGVHDDREAPLVRERGDPANRQVAQSEALSARVQLDSRGAETDRALHLLQGAVARIDATERDEPTARELRRGERVVVGGPVGARFREREHDRAPIHDLKPLRSSSTSKQEPSGSAHPRCV